MDTHTELVQYVEGYLDSNFDGDYTDIEVNQVSGGLDISINLEEDSGMPLMAAAIHVLEEGAGIEKSQVRGLYDGENDVYKLKITDRTEFF